MAELPAVHASGFRQSVQFGFSGEPEGWSAVTMLWEPCGECLALVSVAAKPKSSHFLEEKKRFPAPIDRFRGFSLDKFKIIK